MRPLGWQDIKDTTAALQADGSLSAEVKEKCAAMDADYEKRSKMRSEEQAAVSKTMEVLSADEARAFAGREFTSRIQCVSCIWSVPSLAPMVWFLRTSYIYCRTPAIMTISGGLQGWAI